MAPMIQGRRNALLHAVVLAVAMSTLLDATLAEQYVVGGPVSKWSFLQPNSNATFYNDWAKGISFKTGDSLLFEYNNMTHSVRQLETAAAFDTCNLAATVNKWNSGSDDVFISDAGTYYYVCGAPTHCEQGMKVAITATGEFVAAPPAPVALSPSPSTSPSAPIGSGAAPISLQSAFTLAIALTATHFGFVCW